MNNNNIKASGKKLLLTLAITGGLLLLAFSLFPDSIILKNQNSGVVTATTDNQIPVKLDISSIQNGREIQLTKFVATSDKIEFEYQFKVYDENFKNLLEKRLAENSNCQDIQFEVFADNSTENIALGGTSESFFRLEEDTYIGSVTFNFVNKTIPKYSNLTLHINKLSWEDYDDHQAALAKATETKATSFDVPIALQYEGDWSFKIPNK